VALINEYPGCVFKKKEMGNSIRVTNKYVYKQTEEALRYFEEGHILGNVVTTVEQDATA
jgi:hypothetical protein